MKVKKDIVQFRVFSINDLDVLIKHFDQYPLITQKRGDYLLFKEILKIMQLKEHLTTDGLQKIVNLKASLNLGLSEKQLSLTVFLFHVL